MQGKLTPMDKRWERKGHTKLGGQKTGVFGKACF